MSSRQFVLSYLYWRALAHRRLNLRRRPTESAYLRMLLATFSIAPSPTADECRLRAGTRDGTDPDHFSALAAVMNPAGFKVSDLFKQRQL